MLPPHLDFDSWHSRGDRRPRRSLSIRQTPGGQLPDAVLSLLPTQAALVSPPGLSVGQLSHQGTPARCRSQPQLSSPQNTTAGCTPSLSILHADLWSLLCLQIHDLQGGVERSEASEVTAPDPQAVFRASAIRAGENAQQLVLLQPSTPRQGGAGEASQPHPAVCFSS